MTLKTRNETDLRRTDKFCVSLSPQCLSSDLEHTSTSSDDSKTDEDDDNVPLAQVANKVSFIILEIMSNKTRKKINMFLHFLLYVSEQKKTTSTLKTSTPRVSLFEKHQQRISKSVAAFPLLSKEILLIKTIVATNNVQRPARRRRTVLCM